jgi:hypothetical protein
VASREADIAEAGDDPPRLLFARSPDNPTTHAHHPGTTTGSPRRAVRVPRLSAGGGDSPSTLPHNRRGILLVGQAPGPREASLGSRSRGPRANALRVVRVGARGGRADGPEAHVPRCGHTLLPGEGAGGGDRRPDPDEVARCSPWLRAEVEIMRPEAGGPGGDAGHRRGDGPSGRPGGGGGHVAPAALRGPPRGRHPRSPIRPARRPGTRWSRERPCWSGRWRSSRRIRR